MLKWEIKLIILNSNILLKSQKWAHLINMQYIQELEIAIIAKIIGLKKILKVKYFMEKQLKLSLNYVMNYVILVNI